MQSRGVRLKYYLRESIRCHVQYDTDHHPTSKTAAEGLAHIFITYGGLSFGCRIAQRLFEMGFPMVPTVQHDNNATV